MNILLQIFVMVILGLMTVSLFFGLAILACWKLVIKKIDDEESKKEMGNAQFIESESIKEKFNKAESIDDMI